MLGGRLPCGLSPAAGSLLLIVMHTPLAAAAPLVAEHGPQGAETQQMWQGSVSP